MNEHLYETTSLYLATFLAAKNMRLVTVVRERNGQCTFCFEDGGLIRSLADTFLHGNPEIEVHVFIQWIKRMKECVYETK